MMGAIIFGQFQVDDYELTVEPLWIYTEDQSRSDDDDPSDLICSASLTYNSENDGDGLECGAIHHFIAEECRKAGISAVSWRDWSGLHCLIVRTSDVPYVQKIITDNITYKMTAEDRAYEEADRAHDMMKEEVVL